MFVERMAVEIEGEGEPVLMIHGLGGTANTFTPVLAAFARLRGARTDGGPRRLRRGQQRAEERQARDARGLRGGEMGRDDRAHGVRDEVRPLDPRPVHDQARLVDEQREGERRFHPMRAPRPRQVESDGPVARQRRQDRCEDVGRSTEAVDHQHRLALTFDLDSHPLDEHSTLQHAAARYID